MDELSEWTDERLAGLGFEEAQARLEAVVAELEAGKLPLERSLALFGLGLRLRDHCRKLLTAAETALEKLVERPDGGVAIEESEAPQ